MNRHVCDVTELMLEGTAIDESLRIAFARTVLRHRQLGLPLVVWHDGRVAEIPADAFPLDPAVEALARR